MERAQIIEQLNDLAERVRNIYKLTKDEVPEKDIDAIMGALDLIGTQVRAAEVSNEGEIKNITFSADVALLADLKALAEKWRRSAECSPVAASFLSHMAPGLKAAVPVAMEQTKKEADLIQRAYSRMKELLGGTR